MTIRSILLVLLLAVAGLSAAWFMSGRRSAPPAVAAAPSAPPARSMTATTLDVHRALPGESGDGEARPAPRLPALADVLTAESGLSYPQRLAVIHALPATLNAADHDALLAVVARPGPLPGLTASQSNAFKNDILNALGRQSDPARRAEVAALLRAVVADPAQEGVLRDYALQHLAGLGAQVDDGTTHLAALEGADPALAATALLHLLARERTGDLGETLRARAAVVALRLAADTNAPAPSRTTALQACGRLKLTEARALAYDLARSDRASMPLRIAAIATLGDLGDDTATRTYLTTLVTGPERRLRVPAESALKRLSIN